MKQLTSPSPHVLSFFSVKFILQDWGGRQSKPGTQEGVVSGKVQGPSGDALSSLPSVLFGQKHLQQKSLGLPQIMCT